MNIMHWTPQLDNILIKVIEKCDDGDWYKVAKTLLIEYNFIGITGKQCKQRWYNFLDPNIKFKIWTKQQDELLFKLILKNGNRWDIIMKSFQKRQQSSVKNRYFSTLRKCLRKVNRYINKKNKGKQTNKIQLIYESTLNLVLNIGDSFYKQKRQYPVDMTLKCIEIKQQLLKLANDDEFKQDYSQEIEELIRNFMIFNKKKDQNQKKRRKKRIIQLESYESEQLQQEKDHQFQNLVQNFIPLMKQKFQYTGPLFDRSKLKKSQKRNSENQQKNLKNNQLSSRIYKSHTQKPRHVQSDNNFYNLNQMDPIPMNQYQLQRFSQFNNQQMLNLFKFNLNAPPSNIPNIPNIVYGQDRYFNNQYAEQNDQMGGYQENYFKMKTKQSKQENLIRKKQQY